MIEGEPPLDDLLAEPIVWLMAQSDGVSLEELRTLYETVREWLARPLLQPELIQILDAGEEDYGLSRS